MSTCASGGRRDVLGGDEGVPELAEEELERVAEREERVLPEVDERAGVVARADLADVELVAALAEDPGRREEGGVCGSGRRARPARSHSVSWKMLLPLAWSFVRNRYT